VIFVTVGTQLPFDRLIRFIDDIAPDLTEPVFAQTGASTYVPRNIEWAAMVSAKEFSDLMAKVSVIVAHAGIGTIISAQRDIKPLILMPRLASQNEHRNDHQVATVKSLKGRSGIYIANTQDELRALLTSKLAAPDALQSSTSRERLISAVSRVIHS